MEFVPLPIPDRQVPHSEAGVAAVLEKLGTDLTAGKNVVVRCRQGVDRSGLVAACLLVTKGLAAQTAVERLSAARSVPVPETTEQRRWIDHYASLLASAR